MEDRFTRGFVAGITAGILSFIINFGGKMLNLSTLVWSDFMGLFLLGKRPEGVLPMAFTLTSQFVLLGLMGIIFAFLITFFSSENYLLKSWLFGVTIWFSTYFLTFLFKLSEIEKIPIKTAITHAIGASVWGIGLGLILNWLDDRLKT
ncbi:hypothetical protein MWH28_11965 [Natroniella sulfidigena]|uniref:hypothetical protein n=1 Tax=Natroniella sulfidigena TaxID=723921 RepID=UPI00200B4BBB|nr:hypothetical protein [Natroniella sulfidigena]MCK8818074.1 hypothetical protein [Natroniella sulfidigena]